MSDQQNRPDLDEGEREMTNADFTASDPEHGKETDPSRAAAPQPRDRGGHGIRRRAGLRGTGR